MSSSSRACFSDGFLAKQCDVPETRKPLSDEGRGITGCNIWRQKMGDFGKGWDTSETSNSSITKRGRFWGSTCFCCHVVILWTPWYLIHPPNGFFASQGCHNGKSQYVQWAQLKHETLNWKDSMDEFSSSRKPIKSQEIVWFFQYYIKHIVWGHLMLSFG